ncbi:MAG: 2-hydroxyacyl-CoA dehydratase [Thermodesulfobacteriota bacterium]
MRQALREYNFDWMLWQTFDLASKMSAASSREWEQSMKYMPGFRDVVQEVLQTGKPGEIFMDICARYMQNLVNAKENGSKNAITTFCFSPAIFYAMDINPICLEVVTVMMTFIYKRGTSEFLDFCNEVGFTETSCSSQRGTLGAYLSGMGADIDMIVTDTPGVCDTNANAFAFASAYLDIPFFQMDMPFELTGERNDYYHREDFKSLITFLQEQTGKKLDIDRLRSILGELEKQDRITAELDDLAMLVPNPLPVSFNLMLYACRFLFAGKPECTRVLEAMLEIGRENARLGKSGLKQNEEKLRPFFCYIDHYAQNLKFWQMLEDLGMSYTGNILSRYWTPHYGKVKDYDLGEGVYQIDKSDLDTMIDSLAAQNSRMPMIKSIRGPYDAPHMWLQETLALAKMYSADLIVYSGTPGCRNTWGMVKLLARDTEKAGFPTYIMYSDAFDERVESFENSRERFEEFLNVRRLLT